MRILLINNEAHYFAGAQVLLKHFLSELVRSGDDVTAAVVPGSRVEQIVPEGASKLFLPATQEFSLPRLARQVAAIVGANRRRRFDVIHAWAARDWELGTLARLLARRPVLGTLHDHPEASFIRPRRRRLMRACARRGLTRVACISEAVRTACVAAGYPPDRLEVIHNGTEVWESSFRPPSEEAVRIGFLGAFSRRKGLQTLFEAANELAGLSQTQWELHLGGEAQDAEARELVRGLRKRFQAAPWWPRVRWRGWIERPRSFLEEMDALVCPSAEFEPFGLVVCEAGLARLPAVASDVGGLPEIILNGKTGFLFKNGDSRGAAKQLAQLLENPSLRRDLGENARRRVETEFGIGKMVARYRQLYSTLASYV